MTVSIQGKEREVRLFGLRELKASIIGALVYAGITWFTAFAQLDGIGDSMRVDLRPAVVTPIIIGFLYGPIAGFLTGTVGNLLTDYLLWQEVWWQWSVGNGIMGLLPGFYAMRYSSYYTFKDQLSAFLVSIAGIFAGMGFASFSTIIICQTATSGSILEQIQAGRILANCPKTPITIADAWSVFFQPAAKVNIVNTLILQPLLFFNIERLDVKGIDWLGSGLLRRLLVAVIVSAALPITLLGFFLTQQFSGQGVDSGSILPKLLATIFLTLIFTVANASLVAQNLTANLLRLTKAAQRMEDGNLDDAATNELLLEDASDEIGILSRVFGRMAREVIQREQGLRQQLQQLRIEIDASKRDKQVNEIVETDFFRELREKAQEMRDRTNKA